MFASSSIALLLSATAVMASAHQGRSHNAMAARMNNNTNSVEKRDSFVSKEMTWYPTDTGPDACTGKNHKDSDFYVAMGYDQFGDGKACCGRQLRINYNGKSAVATCVDECATCPQWGQIDLTKDLFKYFTNGDLDVGVIYGSWSFVDEGDDGDDDTTTTKKTTTKAATTTKKTSTYTPPTTKAEPTTTYKAAVKATPKPSSTKASSSKKPSSSSVKPSSSKASSSAKPSSSAKASSSAAAPTASTTPVGGVANVGGSSSSDGSAVPVAGGLGTGSESGATSFGFNKVFAAVAVVALAAAQAI